MALTALGPEKERHGPLTWDDNKTMPPYQKRRRHRSQQKLARLRTRPHGRALAARSWRRATARARGLHKKKDTITSTIFLAPALFSSLSLTANPTTDDGDTKFRLSHHARPPSVVRYRRSKILTFEYLSGGCATLGSDGASCGRGRVGLEPCRRCRRDELFRRTDLGTFFRPGAPLPKNWGKFTSQVLS
jgi:hypothetical protein